MRSARSLIAVFPVWEEDVPEQGDKIVHNGHSWVVDTVIERAAWTTVVQLRPHKTLAHKAAGAAPCAAPIPQFGSSWALCPTPPA